jgi:hypothetical protein
MPTEIKGSNIDKIARDFQKMHAELKKLEKSYNPQKENLHLTALKLADTNLCSTLLHKSM